MITLNSLTAVQLRKAAEIKERIQELESELADILGGVATAPSSASETAIAAPKHKPGNGRRRGMSDEARARISAAQKKRWAERRASKGGARMSAAAKEKISQKMKEAWARRKAQQ